MEDSHKTKFLESDCIDILEDCYKLYGKSVVLSRAIPFLYDGLKPVQKRIYYTIYRQGYNVKLIKSTAVCADVQKYFHPHGEAAVYSALAKLAQKFYTRIPVIDTQGNWGSDEDAPAASRYTECKGNGLLKLYTEDLKYDSVPMIINYAGSDFEPLFLPARLPMIFVNGAYGIAVGYATSILPHNVREVFDWMQASLTEQGSVRPQDYLKGPDFPLGGQVILDGEWIRACETGRGSIVLRSKYKTKKISDKLTEINFYELPYRQVRHMIIKSLNDAHEKNLLPGVVSFADVSDRKGISLVVHVKTQFLRVAIARIFKHTNLEHRLHINNVVVVDNKPMLLDYQTMMNKFIINRREICTRKITYRLNEILLRIKKLRVNLVLYQLSERVVEIVKNSNDPEGDLALLHFDLSSHWKGKENVPSNLHLLTGVHFLSDEDIHYLLTLTIARLKKRFGEDTVREVEEILREYSDLQEILAQPALLDDYLIRDAKEALELIPENQTTRRSEVLDTNAEGSASLERGDAGDGSLIILYENSIVGRYLQESFQDQRRGGKGKRIGESEEIKILSVCQYSDRSRLVALTNLGNLRFIDTDKIPYYFEISNLYCLKDQFQLKDDEHVINILDINTDSRLMFLLTSLGRGKLINTGGITRGRKLISLKANETLMEGQFTTLDQQLLVFTNVNALRCPVTSLRISNTGSGGVKVISVGKRERVVGSITCREDDNFYLVYSNGLVKMNSVKNYRSQSRGGVGVKISSTSKSKHNLVGVKRVTDKHITVILSDGRLLRSVLDLNILGRRAKGVKLVDIDDSKIIGIC